jgi:YihY family inner membrane protein
MNPIERTTRYVDAWQQRHRVTAFTFAVLKKFGDDQAGNLVALLTYFAFLATFPLLLALTGVLGLVLQGHPGLQGRVEDSALAEFPIIGDQLHSQLGIDSLHHSTAALVIGIIGAIFGGRGFANAIQNVLNTLWQVPMVDRPGFPSNWLRSFALLGMLGVGAIVTAGTASVAGAGHALGLHGIPVKLAVFAVSTAVDIGLFLAVFRFATAKAVPSRDLLVGAILSGVAWQVLLSMAGLIVSHDLRHAQEVAGLFGLVLGLLAWFGLQATVTVYAIEADVVRVRGLWPRSVTQPPLTAADKDFLARSAKTQIRRPEQQVDIDFTAEADHDPLRDDPPHDG